MRSVSLAAVVMALAVAGQAEVPEAFVLDGVITIAADGTPASEAQVWLAQESGVQHVDADGEGRYRFDVQHSGAYQLVAMAQGAALAGDTGFIAGDATIDLSLPAPQIVTVEVIGPTSQPLSGARLAWLNVNGQFNVPAIMMHEAGFPDYRSGGDGKLTLPPLPVGGFVRLRLNQFDHADLVVDYLPVREKQPALQMTAGQRVGGRVLSPEQQGIEGARVRVFQVGVSSQREFASAITDREGFFHCRVPVGEYSVGVRHPEWASPEPAKLAVKGDEEAEAIVTMLPPRHIEGRILLPDGKPAAGTYVAFLKGETVYEETFTDASGTFHLRVPSPEGTLSLVPPHGYVTEQIADIPIAMEEAKEVTLKPITLRAIPRLTGKVVDAEGRPVANAIITTPKLPDPSRLVSEENGAFDFLPDYLPEERVVYFHVEHPHRFEHADFIVDFSTSQQVEVKLQPYNPVPPTSSKEGDAEAEVPEPHRPLLGKEAPPLSVAQSFNSPEISLGALKGKAVMLCFWGSFDDSPQGSDALEQLSLLQEVYGNDESVALVGIHDATSTVEEVQAFVDAAGIKFPIGLDTQRFETFMAYKVTYIPEFVLIDKQGQIRFRQPGEKLVEHLKVLRRE